MTQPRTMTVEREVQIFGYTYLTKHNMWEVENELKAERAALAQLQADYNSSQQTVRELRESLMKAEKRIEILSEGYCVMQAERDRALSELAKLKKDKK